MGQGIANASVMLAVLRFDEPWIFREGSMRLLREIEDGRLNAFLPDQFLKEVLGGVLKAPFAHRPLLVAAANVFRFLSRISLPCCHEGEVRRPDDVWATALTQSMSNSLGNRMQL